MKNQLESTVQEPPFHGDRLERKRLAESLTNYVDRVAQGSVIAINAGWGEGKTWFAKNWQRELSSKGYPTVYFDAFACDYSDDPFVSICAELAAVAPRNKKSSFINAAKRIGAAAAPLATKVAFAAASHLIIGDHGSSELSKEAKKILDSTTSAAEKYIEKRIEELAKIKNARAEFSKQLQDLASSQEKPLVFFIDELDRCRPDFAVQIIERVKHYFDCTNLVFVLVMHRSELEQAIKGVYGSIDASGYLGKFIHLSIDLAPQTKIQDRDIEKLRDFISFQCSKYKFDDFEVASSFETIISKLAPFLKMSLRDIERVVLLFSLARHTRDGVIFGYLACLKIKQPQTYEKLRRGDKDSHREAEVSLRDYYSEDGHIKFLRYLHALEVSDHEVEKNVEYKVVFSDYQIPNSRRHAYTGFFSSTFRSLDIAITY